MTAHAQLVALLNRAADDPIFLERLAANPLEVALAHGLNLTAQDLKGLTGLAGASDGELLEVIRVRLNRSSAIDGCGACS